jgi:hypothetical protein
MLGGGGDHIVLRPDDLSWQWLSLSKRRQSAINRSMAPPLI